MCRANSMFYSECVLICWTIVSRTKRPRFEYHQHHEETKINVIFQSCFLWFCFHYIIYCISFFLWFNGNNSHFIPPNSESLSLHSQETPSVANADFYLM